VSTSSSTNKKTLICVHGGGWKPAEPVLRDLWVRALATGLQRDHGHIVNHLANVDIRFVYYGDLVNATLQYGQGEAYDEALDIADREAALNRIIQFDKTKRFRRVHYEVLPGKNSIKEFLADIGAPLASRVGLGSQFWARVAPLLRLYMRGEAFAQTLDKRVGEALQGAIDDHGQTLILSHCLGTVAVYNGLWDLAFGVSPDQTKFHTWITMGSPLGDETVKKHLRGADAPDARRYPNNLLNWHNLAAEDDYICHDETVANDFAAMLERHQLSQLVDYRIYNLAVRYGRSNPHSSVGYLAHPRTSELLANWLTKG
jgi:hypothetical protein